MHRNRNRIITAEKSQPICPRKNRCVQFDRVNEYRSLADFDRKSSPGDGALSSKPTTEFAQPSLLSGPNDTDQTHTHKFVASHLVKTRHIGTKTPKFVPSRWGRPPFDLLKQGCANSAGAGGPWASWGEEAGGGGKAFVASSHKPAFG